MVRKICRDVWLYQTRCNFRERRASSPSLQTLVRMRKVITMFTKLGVKHLQVKGHALLPGRIPCRITNSSIRVRKCFSNHERLGRLHTFVLYVNSEWLVLVVTFISMYIMSIWQSLPHAHCACVIPAFGFSDMPYVEHPEESIWDSPLCSLFPGISLQFPWPIGCRDHCTCRGMWDRIFFVGRLYHNAAFRHKAFEELQ